MNLSLIIWDESGEIADREFTDPDAILAALAEAGVLEAERMFLGPGVSDRGRYVSPWKEAT